VDLSCDGNEERNFGKVSFSIRAWWACRMKKYLLLVEDEELWARFKASIQKDINSEIMELIEEKVKNE
jgi:hypothetical protein